jgi:hypothetical protein
MHSDRVCENEPQLALASRQATGDFAQALGVAQLAVQHGDQLGPTIKATRVALGLMFSDPGLELQAWDELQNLAENTAYSIHGGSLRVVESLVLEGNPESHYRSFRHSSRATARGWRKS